jgi:putative ATPase
MNRPRVMASHHGAERIRGKSIPIMQGLMNICRNIVWWDDGGWQMDLFEYHAAQQRKKEAPLADRMRPRTLDEFIGQEHIVGQGRLLRRAIEADRITSLIFYGPPGTGKTTLARIIANHTASFFESLNAVSSGVADLRRVVSEAQERYKLHGKRTIIFVDEIHRFNRAQQDALLPAVEDGTIILIGATTENPFFEINSPLISRSRIFRLEPLSGEGILRILAAALDDSERGLARFKPVVDETALQHLANIADGDARVALNALELAVLTTEADASGQRHVTLEIAEESIQRRQIRYDKTGDNHYDVISAFIKSMRGSDPDAAVYWLARMIEAGEDARFIARRIVVHAAEDVGMADPMALVLAVSAAQAVEFIGLPEARIPLAQAAIYIACAHKSNSTVNAIDSALKAVRDEPNSAVPAHLKDASYAGAARLGHGVDYQYPHNFPEHFVLQQYLPGAMVTKQFYLPSENGAEAKVKERLTRLWQDDK